MIKEKENFQSVIMWLLCWIFGHNKMLERRLEDEYEKYFLVCSQCHKRWLHNELNKNQKTQTIEKPVHAKPVKHAVITVSHNQSFGKKELANIYLI